jgi:hypothetical protein
MTYTPGAIEGGLICCDFNGLPRSAKKVGAFSRSQRSGRTQLSRYVGSQISKSYPANRLSFRNGSSRRCPLCAHERSFHNRSFCDDSSRLPGPQLIKTFDEHLISERTVSICDKAHHSATACCAPFTVGQSRYKRLPLSGSSPIERSRSPSSSDQDAVQHTWSEATRVARRNSWIGWHFPEAD